MSIGKVLAKDELIMGEVIGEASWGDHKYEMARDLTSAMIVKDINTGKQFVVSWQAVFEAAVEAGVSEEDESCH